jgi:tyrosyl-tRNA synthetase
MPLLEGTDGVQKMSKSYGNYIGITEAPEEMFGKVMSIGDELMWRYYELLTDVTTAQIEELQKKVASGDAHPMKVKQELGRILVKDFHSAEAAQHAAENWSKQFQKKEVPDELEEVKIQLADVAWTPASEMDLSGSNVGSHAHNGIRMDKVLAKSGLADSVTDAVRKLKAGSVKWGSEGDLVQHQETHIHIAGAPPYQWIVRVGKRMKRVVIS